MVIEVNKDIDRYQESVAMGLTARQLIFSIASVVVGGGIVLSSLPVHSVLLLTALLQALPQLTHK